MPYCHGAGFNLVDGGRQICNIQVFGEGVIIVIRRVDDNLLTAVRGYCLKMDRNLTLRPRSRLF